MTIRLVRTDGTVCAPGATSDNLALCGGAHEGDGDDLAPVVAEAGAGAITCPHCCAILTHVRGELRRVRCEPAA